MREIYVAQSYKDLPKIGDVFISNGKEYINVQLKSGKIKAVRSYSFTEYKKMYPNAIIVDTSKRNQKEVLGFDKGYITVFNNFQENDKYFSESNARFARWWGWYIISTQQVLNDLPPHSHVMQLPWELVGEENGKLKAENQVLYAVRQFYIKQNKK